MWISRHGTCFWVGHACAMKCEKCEKEGKMYALEFKNVSTFSNCTECEDMVVFLFASLGAAALSPTHCS